MAKKGHPRPFRKLCDASSPEWHRLRDLMVTGSDVASVLNKSPWKKREELLLQKRAANDNGFVPSRSMLWGSLAERANMAHFSQITGVRFRHTNAFLQSTLCPLIGATLDGLCRISVPEDFHFLSFCSDREHAEGLSAEMLARDGQFGILEMKQTEAWNLKNWKVAPPEYYYLQVQAQLFTTGLDWALLVCKIGAADIRAYFVDADPLLHEDMIEAVQTFWEEVRNG